MSGKFDKDAGFTWLRDMAGESLGRGSHREVFACRDDPELVVKIARPDSRGVMENCNEFALWRLREDLRQWLCPCVALSWGGWALLMRRGERVASPGQWRELPAVLRFRDCHAPQNWVRLDGRLVLCDYGRMVRKGEKYDPNLTWSY